MDPQDVPHLFKSTAHTNDLSHVNILTSQSRRYGIWTWVTWTNRRGKLKRAYNNIELKEQLIEKDVEWLYLKDMSHGEREELK